MLPTDTFHARTRALLSNHPLPLLFPPEPWDDADLEVIAAIVEDHVQTSNDVVTDKDPYSDWLDRYRFYRRGRQTVGE